MANKYSKYVNTENIRRERFAKQISPETIIKSMGKTSPSSYYNIENGDVEPKISDMLIISKLLGKPVSYFFNFEVQETQTA